MSRHSDLTGSQLHEPKGVENALLGEVYAADGAGSGSWVNFRRSGFFDYNDAATAGSPIVVPGTGAFVKLTNDTLGAFTNRDFPPTGVTDVWDDIAQEFNWSQLQNGDTVDIRIDLELTTTSANQQINIGLELGGGAYTLPFGQAIIKTADTGDYLRYSGIYIGDDTTRLGGGFFKIASDSTLNVVVRGWYVRILPGNYL